MKSNGKVFVHINFGKYEEITFLELLRRCAEDGNYRNKKFYPFNDILMEVSVEDYKSFYKSHRRQKYLIEESILHQEVSFNALDSDEMSGEEAVIDPNANVEEATELSLMIGQLYKCLDLLTDNEYMLIYSLFYERKSEREYAAELGIYHNAVHKRKNRILSKLKNFLNN